MCSINVSWSLSHFYHITHEHTIIPLIKDLKMSATTEAKITG